MKDASCRVKRVRVKRNRAKRLLATQKVRLRDTLVQKYFETLWYNKLYQTVQGKCTKESQSARRIFIRRVNQQDKGLIKINSLLGRIVARRAVRGGYRFARSFSKRE